MSWLHISLVHSSNVLGFHTAMDIYCLVPDSKLAGEVPILTKMVNFIPIVPEKVGVNIKKIFIQVVWHVVLTKTFKNGVLYVPNLQIICCEYIVVHSYFNAYALVSINHRTIFVLQQGLIHSARDNSIFIDVSCTSNAGCITRASQFPLIYSTKFHFNCICS